MPTIQLSTRRNTIKIKGRGPRGLPGIGIPVGGTTGQVLTKDSNTDYDTEWTTITGTVISVNGESGAVTIDKGDVGLGNVTNDLQLKASDLDTNVTLAANSDSKIASQKATKAYVDTQVASGTIPDATTLVKGKVQLAGDLSGTASVPTVVETHLSAPLPLSQGGTGAITSLAARTSLGLAIGADIQAFDTDLDTIAGLSPLNDNVLQRKAGAWTHRTPAQLKTDLALLSSDVGLGNVPNVDATLRANHTGTQLASTVSDFSDAISVLLQEGTGISLTYNGGANTLTIASTISSYTDEQAQDAVGNILTDTNTIDQVYNDGTNTITADVRTQMSLTSDASGIRLSGDASTPGNSKYYGTDSGGTKGYFDIPASSVTSVNGQSGVVVLDSDDITEGVANLYYTDERTSDLVGSMVTGNTETGIAVTYQDADNTLDFAVTDSPLLNGQNAAFYLARTNHTGTQTASTVSDFDTQVRTSRLDQMAAPTANVSLNSNKLVSVADPTADQDAATKAYVDAVAQGVIVKDSVQVATTGNITLSGEQTIDGVLTSSSRVLVKDQSAGSENGIYVSSGGAWSRSTDADTGAELVAGTFTFVSEGTVNASSGWVQTTTGTITLGSTTITFSQFSGAGQIIAGAALLKTGNTLDVVAGTGITVAGDSVSVDSTVYRQGSTDVAIADGGTAASTASEARTNLGLAIGTDVQGFDSDLSALAGLSTTGLISRTGSGTATIRSIVAGSSKITVSNGDGVSGNPSIDLGTVATTDITGFTEAAQDAVGGTLTDTSSVDFTYNDGSNTISAVVLPAGVDKNSLGGSALSVANGGTGASTAAGSRTNLGTEAQRTFIMGATDGDFPVSSYANASVALLALLTAAQAVAGEAYIKAGTYDLPSQIVFHDLSNVTLRGAGPGKTILRRTFTGGQSMLDIGSGSGPTISSNITVSDLTIDQNNIGSGWGLVVSWCKNVLIENIKFINQNTTSLAALLVGKFGGGSDVFEGSNIRVVNCVFDYSTAASLDWEVVSCVNGRDVIFDRCTWKGIAEAWPGITVYNTEQCTINDSFVDHSKVIIGGRGTYSVTNTRFEQSYLYLDQVKNIFVGAGTSFLTWGTTTGFTNGIEFNGGYKTGGDVETPWYITYTDFATTDVNTTAETITLSSTTSYPTGTAVRVSSPGTVPGGLSEGVDYYVININSTTIKLATSSTNATAGTAIDLTSQGSGTQKITVSTVFNCENIVIDGVLFKGAKPNAIRSKTSTEAGLEVLDCRDLSITNVTIEDCTGIPIIAFAKTLTIDNVEIRNGNTDNAAGSSYHMYIAAQEAYIGNVYASSTNVGTDIVVDLERFTTLLPTMSLRLRDNKLSAATRIKYFDAAGSLQVTPTANVTLTAIPVNEGGTGGITAATGLNNLLPTQTSNSGKVLQTDGTNASWQTAAGGGAPTTSQYVTLATDGTLTNERVLTGTTNQITVTDGGAGSTVTLSLPQNINLAATPTFAGLTLSSPLAIGDGGTAATTAAAARTSLGLVIGTNVQAFNANTTTLGNTTTGSGSIVLGTSPTIVTPTIASFTNATHNHTNAAGGGQLTDAALSAAVSIAKGGTGQTTLTDLPLTTPRVTTSIKDTNGNPIVTLTPVASAVNSLGIQNNANGGSVVLRPVSSSDTNVGLLIKSLGTGTIILSPDTDNTTALQVRDAGGSVVLINADTTGSEVTIDGKLTADTLRMTTTPTVGYVLTATDTAGNMSWQVIPDATGSVNGLVRLTNDLGGTATAPTVVATHLASALPVAQGGTGQTTLGSGNVLVGAGTSGITSTKVAPSGVFVGDTDTQTLTNKRVNPRVASITSSSTPTPNVDTTDIYEVTALAATATFGAPTGTPVNGQKLLIRIKDNGTARALNWNAVYVNSGVASLPATTVIGKTHMIGLIYDSTAAIYVCLASDTVGY